MAAIYLKHPAHGVKVAVSEAEAIYDEGNGWTRYNPDTPRQAAPSTEVQPQRKRRTLTL